MSEYDTGLTPAMTERLAILIEECAEVQQVACKVLRHGYAKSSPFASKPTTNRADLQTEVGHVLNAIRMLTAAMDLSEAAIVEAAAQKRVSAKQWLRFQEAGDE